MRKIKKKEKGETDKNEREYVNYHCLKIINMKNMQIYICGTVIYQKLRLQCDNFMIS